MKIIKPRVEVVNMPAYEDALRVIEESARTCYKSEGKIAPGSAEKLIRSCLSRKPYPHESVIEHMGFTLRFICDRGVSHELVRHRLCSFSQESTRYVRYDGDMEFIEPWWWGQYLDGSEPRKTFRFACSYAEAAYRSLLDQGLPPQAARATLPQALKTEVVATANIREWRHVFGLRWDKAAHPDMRRVMGIALSYAKDALPVFFEEFSVQG